MRAYNPTIQKMGLGGMLAKLTALECKAFEQGVFEGQPTT